MASDGREERIWICLFFAIDCFCEPRALMHLLFPGGGRKGNAGSGIRASAPLGDGPDPPMAWEPHLHLLFFLQVELLSSRLHPHVRPFGGEDCQAIQSFAPLPLILAVFSLFIKACLT